MKIGIIILILICIIVTLGLLACCKVSGDADENANKSIEQLMNKQENK